MTHLVATRAFAGVERYLTYIAPELASRGIEVHVVGGEATPMRGALDGTLVTWHDVRSMSGLRALRSADVLHAHMTVAETVGAVARRPGSALVATRHFAQRRGSSAAARRIGRSVAHRIDRQVAISRFVASSIEDESVVIPSGVPNADLGAHDEPVVLVAQRLEREKDNETAVRAWAASGLAHEGWRLVVAGRGSLEDELRGLASALGVAGSIEMAGFVDDLGTRMARASVLLATTPAEAFGLAVAEAMACGLTVLAAGSGAHVELIGDVADQLLFAPGDPAEAGARLRAIALDPAMRGVRGDALRERQQAVYSVDAHVAGLTALYEDVFQTRRR